MAAIISPMFDGLANLFSRLGTSADRNVHSFYTVPLIPPEQLEAAYRSSWLTRKIHDLPAFEMTRAGRRWQAEKEQIELLEATETRLQLWAKLRKALTVARLYGGSAIVLGVRQGMPEQPLRPDALLRNSLRYAVGFSRYQLSAPEGFETDPESDNYAQPKMWEIRGPKGGRIRVHPSRVLTFHGCPLPEGSLTLSPIDQFWGDPLLVGIKQTVDNAETAQLAVASLLHEMRQSVLKIPGLTEQIATEAGESLLKSRIEAAEMFKSMFNTLLLDGGNKAGQGGEDWETRQLSFAEHPTLVRLFLEICSGAADIPVTRLLGQSPGGLQSTGKGEQDDFNRMIAARQDADLSPVFAKLDPLLISSALGSQPPEIYGEFAPLGEKSEAENAAIEKQRAETVKTYHDMGILPADALAKAAENRMIESGQWPGLDAALADARLAAQALPGPDPAADVPSPPVAPEQQVQAGVDRGAITRDQGLALLADASPRSLYVRRDLLNVVDVTTWARGQGLDPQDGLHVTVIYSRRPVDWMKAGNDWSTGDNGLLTVRPGGPRMVDRLGGGAVALLFASSALSYRHEVIQREAGTSHDWPDYQPHVTIAYDVPGSVDLSAIEPYRGVLEFGPEIFEEVKP